MREIKFKSLIEDVNGNIYWQYYGVDNKPKFADMFYGGWIKEPIVEDLQFTGLYDKHGKEIYEGDIVKGFYYQELPNPENEKKVAFEIFGEVKWADGYYSFGGKFHPDIDVEVIGNIHEHGHLLGK